MPVAGNTAGEALVSLSSAVGMPPLVTSVGKSLGGVSSPSGASSTGLPSSTGVSPSIGAASSVGAGSFSTGTGGSVTEKLAGLPLLASYSVPCDVLTISET